MKKPTRKKSAAKRQKWQYIREYARNGELPLGMLEDMGEQGWELCATVATPERASDLSSAWPATVQFIFKRPYG